MAPQPPQKLPEAEWKFDDVPDTRARGVFLYEFFRHSRKLRELVLHCRNQPLPRMVCNWTPGYHPLRVTERDLIKKETNGGDDYCTLIEALVNCPKFPTTPALQLSDEDWFKELEHSPALRVFLEAFESKDHDQAMAYGFLRPGIEYRLKRDWQAQAFESVVPLLIDWRKSNAEIVKAFRAHVLSRRSEDFWQFKKVSPKQNAFGDLCINLPFNPVTALNWLGVLRRFEAAGSSWETYLELYDESAKRRIEVGRTDEATWRQNQIDKRDKARRVLKWLEAGMTQVLDRKAFR